MFVLIALSGRSPAGGRAPQESQSMIHGNFTLGAACAAGALAMPVPTNAAAATPTPAFSTVRRPGSTWSPMVVPS